MPHPRQVETEAIVAAYRETGSVWKAAKLLGICGQSVHERLRAIDHPLSRRNWTIEEDHELGELVRAAVPLGEIASRLGRTYASVACRASRMDLAHPAPRKKKLPRGAGLDKASTLKHIAALEKSPAKVTQYARQYGFNVDTLVYAFQKHCPERWNEYQRTHSPIPEATCEYCKAAYVPANGKQRYCSRTCGATANRDASYFGGQRRNTIGLADEQCQLCGRIGVKGLSSHHVLGKENDPDNHVLVAVCPGCHKLIGQLGGMNIVDNPRALESLISLAWMRKHGPDAAAGKLSGKSIYTEVILELWDEDDEYAEPEAS